MGPKWLDGTMVHSLVRPTHAMPCPFQNRGESGMSDRGRAEGSRALQEPRAPAPCPSPAARTMWPTPSSPSSYSPSASRPPAPPRWSRSGSRGSTCDHRDVTPCPRSHGQPPAFLHSQDCTEVRRQGTALTLKFTNSTCNPLSRSHGPHRKSSVATWGEWHPWWAADADPSHWEQQCPHSEAKPSPHAANTKGSSTAPTHCQGLSSLSPPGGQGWGKQQPPLVSTSRFSNQS